MSVLKVYIPSYGLFMGKGCGLRGERRDAWDRALDGGADAEHPVHSPCTTSIRE